MTTEAEPKPVEPIQEIVSPAVPTPAATFDEVPIGGGNKFNFSEFPEEGSAPKPVKKVVPKRNVKK